jgi:actin-like ATPase involved in cell morphogenesis
MLASERKNGRRSRPTGAMAAPELGPSICTTVRLTDEEKEAVDRHVERLGQARAVLIREAMRRMGLFGKGRIDLQEG